MNDILYVVIPAYNEEEVIENSISVVTGKLRELIKKKKISKDSKILIVDDGSKDETFSLVKGFCAKNKYLSAVKLSRNFGHQNALYAGLMVSLDRADMVISIDADLQDDVEVIEKMVSDYYEGNEIVYGVRKSRDTDNFFKRGSALLFYKMMSFLGCNLVYNCADFRLMSKKALMELAKYEEFNLFLRGIVCDLGFRSSYVYYDRKKREVGETKYNLKKMVSLAVNGITSFSVMPIRFIIALGGVCSFGAFLYLVYVVVSSFFNKELVDGWSTIVVLISFFGSFQILCIGIIGEYISKIYLETKRRPKYIVEDIIE